MRSLDCDIAGNASDVKRATACGHCAEGVIAQTSAKLQSLEEAERRAPEGKIRSNRAEAGRGIDRRARFNRQCDLDIAAVAVDTDRIAPIGRAHADSHIPGGRGHLSE